LWLEYKQANPEGYQYSQFCLLYHQWAGHLDVCLRQSYRAGEKLFVDYAGQTILITDPVTGQSRQAFLFVASLGWGPAILPFCWASESQGLPDWIDTHMRAFAFFGGVPAIVVPDNLKAGVTRACRYEPDLNPTYHEMARHYGTVFILDRLIHNAHKITLKGASMRKNKQP
jgi:transposase